MNGIKLNLLLTGLGRYIIYLYFFLSCFSINLNGQTCTQDIFRSIDGACNNINFENYGSSQRQFFRELPAAYSTEDVFNGINFPNRPNPRAISNTLCAQNDPTGNSANLSSFVYTWGQFLDHDITLAREAHIEAANIPLPTNEPLFTSDISFNRSAVATGTGVFSSRNQENQLTAWVDASHVYGSDVDRANWLRTFVEGKLKTSSGNLLPYNTLDNQKYGIIDPSAPEMGSIDNGQNSHFVAGDIRANEQPGLTTLHTLFLREHNRICEDLVAQGIQNDEEIYQIARKHIGALMQHITYHQFLPAMGVNLSDYIGYDRQVQPDIMNIFATAAYRIGHTMVSSEIPLLDNNCEAVRPPLSLEQGFFNGDWIANLGIEPILKGLAHQQQEEMDLQIVDGLRNFLFAIPQLPGTFGLDLAAINIQRGRDHGLPDYQTVRKYFTNQNITTFEQINPDPVIAQQLRNLFNNDLSSIDLWVGLLAEAHFTNENMGSTMHEILKIQFERLRNGDYYYYLRDPFFSTVERENIEQTQLSDLILRNTQLSDLPSNVFFAESCPSIVNCDEINIQTTGNQVFISNLNAPFTSVKIYDKNAGWAVVADYSGTNCGNSQTFDLPYGAYIVAVGAFKGIWQDLICEKRVEINIGNSNTFDCEEIILDTDYNSLKISNLDAPFSTIKIFDKNAGWAVIADCVGGSCGVNPNFDLPKGNYHVQISAYQSPWQNLICIKNSDIFIGENKEYNCDAVEVSFQNGAIAINGLAAPFCAVKVFDENANWQVIEECSGDECAPNQSFPMENGDYTVEVSMYQGFWRDLICQKYFDMEHTSSSRSVEILIKNKVYPNPVQALLFIDLQEPEGQAATIQLYNQLGQQVKSLSFTTLPDQLVELPVHDLVNGWYYLNLKVEGKISTTEKVVIERLY